MLLRLWKHCRGFRQRLAEWEYTLLRMPPQREDPPAPVDASTDKNAGMELLVRYTEAMP
jgi:hypothetical protein